MSKKWLKQVPRLPLKTRCFPLVIAGSIEWLDKTKRRCLVLWRKVRDVPLPFFITVE